MNTDFHDVMALDALEDRTLTKARAGETEIVLWCDADVVRAFGAICPHKGAPMEKGNVCEGVIVCPWHKAMFSLEDGALREPLALDPLPSFPVEVSEGRVRVSGEAKVLPAPESKGTARTVAILGSGAAGVTAACHLREGGFDGRIAMISPEAEAPYDRTSLTKMVLGEKGEAAISPLRPDGFYEEARIERITAEAVGLDLATRRVFLSNGDDLRADHVLIATGGAPVRPDIPGASLPGVHTLRSAEDARAILATPDLAKASVVIVGASFIGLEAAAALRQRGVGVVIVSRRDVPLEGQFGREVGARLRRLHEENRVAFLSGVDVREIVGTERVERVLLSDGSELRADLVILGTGVSPRSDFAADLPRDDRGAILVDEVMNAADGIYAVGDVASYAHGEGHVHVEHWRSAQIAARIAVDQILGRAEGLKQTPWFWTQQFGKKIEYLGWQEPFDEVRIEGDLEAFDFLATLLREGRPVGLVSAGRPAEMGEAALLFPDSGPGVEAPAA